MTKILFFSIIIFCLFACKAQKIIKYENIKYEGFSYQATLNDSFVNKRLVFLKGTDSVIFNIKIPYDASVRNINDPGIFYNCTLRKDSLYSFELKKIPLSSISEEYNSYYKTNAKFKSKSKSKFIEVSKNTDYQYKGIYGMFVDINHELLMINKMVPAKDCIFQH